MVQNHCILLYFYAFWYFVRNDEINKYIYIYVYNIAGPHKRVPTQSTLVQWYSPSMIVPWMFKIWMLNLVSSYSWYHCLSYVNQSHLGWQHILTRHLVNKLSSDHMDPVSRPIGPQTQWWPKRSSPPSAVTRRAEWRFINGRALWKQSQHDNTR